VWRNFVKRRGLEVPHQPILNGKSNSKHYLRAGLHSFYFFGSNVSGGSLAVSKSGLNEPLFCFKSVLADQDLD
jgi:hypothetical protein